VGGTSGIGEFTLKAFVQNAVSPRVYIVGRNEIAAERIIKECEVINKESKVEFFKADVRELADVDRICKELEKRETKLNLLFQTQGNMDLKGRNGIPPCHPYCSV
jgi:NADP-dependent 3-hydroxy acid dehydrogenase YdfG